MNKVKRLVSVLLIFSIVAITLCLAAEIINNTRTVEADVDEHQPKNEKITSKEYEEYSKYDLVLTSNKKDVSNNKVKYYYIESILKDQIILESENLGNTYYEIYKVSNIDKMLPNFESIREVALMKTEEVNYYSIDYNTLSNERVILEYYSNGIENKTIYNKLTGDFFTVNNQYTKTSYGINYSKTTSLQLSEEKLQKINEYIDNGDIESLKSMDGIDVQGTEGNLIINLVPDYNSNSEINEE